jgi:hypothetical protein
LDNYNAFLVGERKGTPYWLRDTMPQEAALVRRLLRELEAAHKRLGHTIRPKEK